MEQVQVGFAVLVVISDFQYFFTVSEAITSSLALGACYHEHRSACQLISTWFSRERSGGSMFQKIMFRDSEM